MALWKCPACKFKTPDRSVINDHCFNSHTRMKYICPCKYTLCNEGAEPGRVNRMIEHLQTCLIGQQKLPTRDSFTNPIHIRNFLLKCDRGDLQKGMLKPILLPPQTQFEPLAPMQPARRAPPSSYEQATPKAPLKRARQASAPDEDEQRSKRRRGPPQCEECYRRRVRCTHLTGGGSLITVAPIPGPVFTPVRTPFPAGFPPQGTSRPRAWVGPYIAPTATRTPTRNGFSGGTPSQRVPALPKWSLVSTPARNSTKDAISNGAPPAPARPHPHGTHTPAPQLTHAPEKVVIDLTADSDEESEVAEDEDEDELGNSQLNGNDHDWVNQEYQHVPTHSLFVNNPDDLGFVDDNFHQNDTCLDATHMATPSRGLGSLGDSPQWNHESDDFNEPESSSEARPRMPIDPENASSALGPTEAQSGEPTFVMAEPPSGYETQDQLNDDWNLLRQANHTSEQSQAVERIFTSTQHQSENRLDDSPPFGFANWGQLYDDWLQLRKANHTSQHAEAVERIFWWVTEPRSRQVEILPEDTFPTAWDADQEAWLARCIDEVQNAGTAGGEAHDAPPRLSPVPRLPPSGFSNNVALDAAGVDNEGEVSFGANTFPGGTVSAGCGLDHTSPENHLPTSPYSQPLPPAYNALHDDNGDSSFSNRAHPEVVEHIDVAEGEPAENHRLATSAPQLPPDREVIYISDSDDEDNSLLEDVQNESGENADTAANLNAASHAESSIVRRGWNGSDDGFGEEANFDDSSDWERLSDMDP